MYAAPERCQEAEAPVSDLVPEPLDDDRAIGRDARGGRFLLPEKGHEVRRRPVVEGVLAGKPRCRFLVVEGYELASGAADLTPKLERPADALAFPERDNTGDPRRRGNKHTVARDLLDPPG